MVIKVTPNDGAVLHATTAQHSWICHKGGIYGRSRYPMCTLTTSDTCGSVEQTCIWFTVQAIGINELHSVFAQSDIMVSMWRISHICCILSPPVWNQFIPGQRIMSKPTLKENILEKAERHKLHSNWMLSRNNWTQLHPFYRHKEQDRTIVLVRFTLLSGTCRDALSNLNSSHLFCS